MIKTQNFVVVSLVIDGSSAHDASHWFFFASRLRNYNEITRKK